MSDETMTQVPQMTPDELRKRLEEGRPITVLDIRPEEILARLPPTPPNHDTIIAHNKSGQWPRELEDVIELEAGANRCAVE